ncbi:MAG: hypothetical protein QG599_39 [Pseudomonadota bacterium]|nr:hypothetical protein [Pseudomonadota bacterium]
MSTTQPGSCFDEALKAIRRHIMEKGNHFERGPAFEAHGKVLSSVKQTADMYEGMGYAKLMEFGNPPVYAALERGHREIHIFQLQDPCIQEWIEHQEGALSDPAMRAYMLDKSGLTEKDLPMASKPRRYHINEVDGVFIVSTEDID